MFEDPTIPAPGCAQVTVQRSHPAKVARLVPSLAAFDVAHIALAAIRLAERPTGLRVDTCQTHVDTALRRRLMVSISVVLFQIWSNSTPLMVPFPREFSPDTIGTM
jgi:hypothetical protein